MAGSNSDSPNDKLFSYIHDSLSEEQKLFYNSPSSLGNFWTMDDVSVQQLLSKKFDENQFSFSPSVNFNEQFYQPSDFLPNHQTTTALQSSISAFGYCTKCSRPVPLDTLLKHEQSCTFTLESNFVPPLTADVSVSFEQHKSSMISSTSPKEFDSPVQGKTPIGGIGMAVSTDSSSKSGKTKEKEPLNLDKHCGVLMESGQHCQRALTCKMHSMSAKRAVPGRSMDFDKVMAAYRSSRALTGSQKGQATKSVQPSTTEVEVTAGKHPMGAKAKLEPYVFVQTKPPFSKPTLHPSPPGQDSPLKRDKRASESPVVSHPASPMMRQSIHPRDNQRLLESILENDSYFDDISTLSKSLQIIYENSVQLPVIRKTESVFLNPITAKILPAMQELLSKKLTPQPPSGQATLALKK